MTGFGTSVIGCGCEAGIDGELSPRETPDRRPGIRVLLFAVSTSELQRQLQNRVGQCVLTTPGSACYAGLQGEETLKLGNALRFFGDGWQISKRFAGKHYWRVPVMDGEFVCEAATGLTKRAVGGGNLLIMGRKPKMTLAAAEAAVEAIDAVPDVIMPFPGGIVRSGSKVGSKYKASASTNEGLLPDTAGRGDERARARDRVGAGDRHRRIDVDSGCGRHARRPRRHGQTRPQAGCGADWGRKLRGQARPAPLSSEGPVAVKPFVLTMRAIPRRAARPLAAGPTPLSGKTASEIAKLDLHTGRRRSPWATFFVCAAVTRDPFAWRAPAIGSIRSVRAWPAGRSSSTAMSVTRPAAR